eukprot:TRINITY_DN4952_c0_g2_i1.p1 TRINITY_DN4952_c0_g2~~TRINITY_DN4952_c0_g2_i1.p1  ORF type:complete len:109 (-),score=5.34 TRINITY_DN4952_c0_g2_i1:338-664(-)
MRTLVETDPGGMYEAVLDGIHKRMGTAFTLDVWVVRQSQPVSAPLQLCFGTEVTDFPQRDTAQFFCLCARTKRHTMGAKQRKGYARSGLCVLPPGDWRRHLSSCCAMT